jgi:hypothetical protein
VKAVRYDICRKQSRLHFIIYAKQPLLIGYCLFCAKEKLKKFGETETFNSSRILVHNKIILLKYLKGAFLKYELPEYFERRIKVFIG